MAKPLGSNRQALCLSLAAAALALIIQSAMVQSAIAAPPEIRITDRNRVPACVTPERLTRFLLSGNSNLKSQFRDIARYYKEHGEKLRVRWDYAFYQMVIETNYLKFVNNAGKGDVNPKQNNFAGIGTTGGGVPGDSFPDVSTGVLGQMQHLVAYSGEPVANPVAPRTREKQDDIVKKSRSLRRPPTFKDLAGRWAADKRYGTSIEFIANRFREAHCNGRDAEPDSVPPKSEVVAKAGQSTSSKDAGKEIVTAALPQESPKAERGRRGKRDRTARGGRKGKPSREADETTTAALVDDADGTDKVAGLGMRPMPAERATSCAVLTASYGGEKNILIRAMKGQQLQFTALQVLPGQEQRLAAAFVREHAQGGEAVGEFGTRDEALLEAFARCPSAATEVER